MPEEPDQPNPATTMASLGAGHKPSNKGFKTSDPESDTTFLARAMAHISSASFVPPIPIEHPESLLLSVTASSKDSPLIVRVSKEKDGDEPGPLCLLVNYPMVRSIQDTHDFPPGSAGLSTTELVSWFSESVAGGLRDSIGNAQAEDISSWIREQGIGEEEEDPIIYGGQELSDEWWSEGQAASWCRNFWAMGTTP